MTELQQYFARHPRFDELLEAVGILTLEQFASVNPSTVLPELHQAKQMLQIDVQIPPAHVFKEWIAQARTAKIAPSADSLATNSATALPIARPVSANTAALPLAKPIIEAEPKLTTPTQHTDATATIVAEQATELTFETNHPPEVLVEAFAEPPATLNTATSPLDESVPQPEANTLISGAGAMAGKTVSVGSYPIRKKHHTHYSYSHIPSKKHSKEHHSYHLAKKVANKQEEKNYLNKKGIRHLTPVLTWFGALSVILLFVGLLATMALTLYMLLNGLKGKTIVGICFAPIFLSVLFYVIVGLRPSCSICRGKTFSFKGFSRNKAAHHIRPLGYVLSTALHVLILRWFRCPYCGSAQQFSDQSNSHPHTGSHHNKKQ